MATSTSRNIDAVININEGVYEEYEVDPNHPARPMEVVFDEAGNHWLCDKGVNPRGDLRSQGCWRCGEFQFTRQN